MVVTNKRLNEEEIKKSRASFDAFGGRSDGPDQLMAMIKDFLVRRVPESMSMSMYEEIK